MSFDINDMQSGGGNIDPIEVGSYPAIIQSLVSYGVQAQTDYQTGAPKPSEKRLALSFEFPTEAVDRELEDGTVVKVARRLTKEYKVSSHKKAGIMVLIRSVAPGIENLKELLGKPVQVTVGRTSTGKAKITGVSPLMKGIDPGELLNGQVSFDFYNPDEAEFKRMPKFQQDMIRSAEDYNGFADSWVEEDSEY